MTPPPPPQQQPPAQPGYGAPVQPAGPAPGIRYASSGARLVAYIIDGFILGFIVSVIFVIGAIVIGASSSVDSSGSVSTGPAAVIGLLIFLVGLVVGILWKPWFWSHGGQTPGYRILGMRVLRARDGGPLSFGTAILRFIGYIISALIFYIGFIWIIFDGRHQGWHDKIADTLVIQV